MFNHIFQFTHVSGEIILHKCCENFVVNTQNLFTQFSLEISNEIIDQVDDVIGALSQRGNVDIEGVKSVIQIGSEMLTGYKVFEVLIGCRDDPYVKLDVGFCSDAVYRF